MSAHDEPMAYPGARPPVNPDPEVNFLLPSDVDEPFFRSLVRNIKELINPPKLPPLELTSKPVAVKEIWGFYGGQGRRAGMTSFLVHVGVIALLFLLGTNKVVQQVVKQQIELIAPDIAPYKPTVKKDAMHGGGGGGDRSPTPVSKGKLPKLANRQFVPPMVKPPDNPKLVMDPTLIMPPDTNIPKVDSPNLGDPLSKSGLASNGFGSGGGMGSGRGGGVGPGSGPGFGPGSGGGMGGGAYRIGGGVSPPSILYKVEPEYSEEARKAKFQGTVLLFVVVDEKGNPRDIKILRPLGLGLDQKAVEAVEKWKFSPGKKDGKPVPVQAQIEVNFRLL
ncbi:MAG TPA: energy transducer TonB [Bryobacteraceae bacterium]|jgi:periplasmic protein TonB|nr:energy transducer TonB [Bryobacteraceae bacterium]